MLVVVTIVVICDIVGYMVVVVFSLVLLIVVDLVVEVLVSRSVVV